MSFPEWTQPQRALRGGRGGGGRGGRSAGIESQIGRGGVTDAPVPIGVPEDYRARREYDWRSPTGRAPGAQYHSVKPRYHEGDEWKPASASPTTIIQLQEQLVRAGLIGPETRIAWGSWDSATRAAYAELLAMANGAGLNAQAMLNRMGEAQEEAGPPGFAPPLVVRLPNREDLRRSFRETVINLTGEGWSQEDYDAMVDSYYDRIRSAEHQAYEAQYGPMGAAARKGEPGPGGEIVEPASPEAFAEARIRRRDPLAIPAHEMLGHAQDALQLLGSPLWGT